MNVQVNPADVWARAIIAAARAFGDDPIEAVVAAPERGRGSKRQSLPAACLGIAKVSGQPVGRVAPILGLQASHVRARKAHGGPEFRRAVQAAERAAQYALWRPEAAESVAGSASGDLQLVGEAGAESLAPEPAADWEAELAQAVEALPEPAPVAEAPVVERPAHIAKPHTPLAGRVNLAVGQTLRNLAREGRVTAADLAEGQSDRDQAWSVA